MSKILAATLRRLPMLVLTALVLALASPAWAQTENAEASSDPASVEQVESLIATLEDETQRQELIDTLKTLVAADQEAEGESDEGGGDLVTSIARQISQLDDNVAHLLEQLDDGSDFVDWLNDQASDGDLAGLWLEALWQIALVMGGGALGWILVAWLERGQLRKLEQRQNVTWLELPIIALGRICLRIATVLAFAIAAYACLTVLHPNELTRVISIAFINALSLIHI